MRNGFREEQITGILKEDQFVFGQRSFAASLGSMMRY